MVEAEFPCRRRMAPFIQNILLSRRRSKLLIEFWPALILPFEKLVCLNEIPRRFRRTHNCHDQYVLKFLDQAGIPGFVDSRALHRLSRPKPVQSTADATATPPAENNFESWSRR